MATKMAADHTLYHLSPKGFWKRFRDVTVVNPEISSGLPLPNVHRYPQPASRPEKYARPATQASDVSANPYWKRDFRRAYPRLSIVTQNELAQVLLAPKAESIEAPSDAKSAEAKSSVPAAPVDAELTAAIATIAAKGAVYSVTKLPPTPPFRRWSPTKAPNAPHDPNAYWPMEMYTGTLS